MGMFSVINEIEIIGFALLLIRVSAFLVSWPVFGSVQVPQPVKVLLALLMTFTMFSTVKYDAGLIGFDSLNLIMLALREAFVGVCLGFLCRLFFFAVGMAGNIISLTMGLAQAQLYNPALGTSGNSVEQFYTILGTIFFLAINGHHYMLGGLMQSLELIPVAYSFGDPLLFKSFGGVVMELFEIGVKLSAPVLVTIMFSNIAMGIIGRAVPQINVLITALPVNILVGFIVLMISIPLFVMQMTDLSESMAEHLFAFVRNF